MLSTAARLPIGILSRLERRHWIAMLMVALLLGAVAAALLRYGTGVGAARPGEAGAGDTAALSGPPPAAEPLQFRQIAPQDAVAVNAAVPVSDLPNPPATPFVLPAAFSEIDRARALDCLTAAVYYEAAVEATDGQRAVAQVVLNRARHPAYPNSVCGVVYQGAERRTGCQFTFTCDGSLRRMPSATGWARARAVAQAALGGYVHAPVGWATHYHANYVVPYWSSSLTKLGTIGAHIFYRWSGSWGTRPAFRSGYAPAEPYIFQVGDLVDLLGNPIEGTGELALDAATAAAETAGTGVPVPGPTEPVVSFRSAVLRPAGERPAAPAAGAPPAAPPAPAPTAYRSRLTRQPAQPPQAAAEAPQPAPPPGGQTQAATR